MMGEMRPDVLVVVVGLLRGGKFPQGKGCLSSGIGNSRKYGAETLFAEAAIRADVIPPATYHPGRNRWAYVQEEFWLPKEVCDWVPCSPVGPELIVPGVADTPMSLMYVGDMGATFAALADALSNSVPG